MAESKRTAGGLEGYDPSMFDKPSVTVDILVVTAGKRKKGGRADESGDGSGMKTASLRRRGSAKERVEPALQLLLVKRDNEPFRDFWALPGGFVGMHDELEDAARRKLAEKACVEGVYMEQLYTFGGVERDPRMRIISVAYLALVPEGAVRFEPGNTVSDAAFFNVERREDGVVLSSTMGLEIKLESLAFDHGHIISVGLERMRGKVDYISIIFELLRSKSDFTLLELKRAYDCLKGEESNLSNFRKMIMKRYLDQGFMEESGHTTKRNSVREAKCYRVRAKD